MKRLCLLFAAAVFLALGQEHGAPPAAPPGGGTPDHTVLAEAGAAPAHDAAGEHHGDPMIGWKWLNFAILAGILGYLIGKNAPPFFRGRTAEIQRDIREATRMREEAEARAAEMERRLASLGAEIEALRRDAHRQMEHEAERIRQDTAQQIARVQHSAEQEINSAAKHATSELKAYSAQLAIDLAEQRIRAQMSPETQSGLVDRFVRDLDRKGLRN